MKITASHGSGGRDTSWLIKEIFEKSYGNEILSQMSDAAVVPVTGEIAFTTDSFVVKPVFFPGGDIGRLSVCGTVNDLLTAGAVPKYISAGFILEEGLETDDLKKIALSMAQTACEAGVKLITGDTKVVEGSGGILINTSGIGILNSKPLCAKNIREGDAILLTGTLGDHHACILSSRMNIENNIKSDAAPLCGIVRNITEKNEIHAMRDVTRGGLGTVLNEIADSCVLKAELWEEKLPVSEPVAGLCGILGLDPMYMGNEGKMLIAVPWGEKDAVLEIIRESKYGENAALIGCFKEGRGVTLKTRLGGIRNISPLSGEGLPRIC